ncbi:MAG: hypothetical protein WB767_07650 [Nocardioides sp.]
MARWAGPPPLLIAATVLGVVIAPAVSQADEGGVARQHGAGTSLTASLASGGRLNADEQPPAQGSDETPAQPGQASDAPSGTSARREAAQPQLLGVASFNQFRQLSVGQARADALALTERKGVAIIGWQEGYSFGPVYSLLRRKGWDTKRFTPERSERELAVSWRRSRFSLVGAVLHRVAPGVDDIVGRYPFGDRFVLRVTLRERATGREISVINTHLPQAIEDLDRAGRWRETFNAARARGQLERMTAIWRRAPGRWVIGTGDYNFDARSDARVRPLGGISRRYAGTAVSTYASAGFGDIRPTHPTSQRYIDYVHVATADIDAGRIAVLGHRTLNGLNSDHRPLIAWLKLS